MDRTDGQAYGHVITRFLGWIDYQMFIGPLQAGIDPDLNFLELS